MYITTFSSVAEILTHIANRAASSPILPISNYLAAPIWREFQLFPIHKTLPIYISHFFDFRFSANHTAQGITAKTYTRSVQLNIYTDTLDTASSTSHKCTHSASAFSVSKLVSTVNVFACNPQHRVWRGKKLCAYYKRGVLPPSRGSHRAGRSPVFGKSVLNFLFCFSVSQIAPCIKQQRDRAGVKFGDP